MISTKRLAAIFQARNRHRIVGELPEEKLPVTVASHLLVCTPQRSSGTYVANARHKTVSSVMGKKLEIDFYYAGWSIMTGFAFGSD